VIHGRRSVLALQQTFRLIDPLLLTAVMLLVGGVRWGSLPRGDDAVVAGLVISFTLLVFNLGEVYPSLGRHRVDDWIRAPLRALALALALLLAAGYATKTSSEFSRLVLAGWTAVSALALVASRSIAHRVVVRRHRAGRGVEPVILVGGVSECLSFQRHLKRHPELGLRAVGIVGDPLGEGSDGGSALIARDLRDLPVLVTRFAATRVFLCGRLGDHETMLTVLQLLMPLPVDVHYAPDYSTMPIFSFRVGDCGGRPVMDLSASPLSDQAVAIKWVEDKVLALVILVISAPVMLAIMAALACTGGPIFFRQERHGLHGRPFRMIKFRTMREAALGSEVVDAEAALVAAAGQVGDAFASDFARVAVATPAFRQATGDDPRVTRLGRFLRRASLDELPQFLNVLTGDMSIVGPRPHAIAHNQQFIESIGDLMRRHYVKPGITGLAQISGARGETRTIEQMRKRIQYDLDYIRNWSLWLDLRIIALTTVKGFFNRQP